MITNDEAEKLRNKYNFLVRAENLGLGVSRGRKIDHPVVNMA